MIDSKYDTIWLRTTNKGYCFTAHIPCRIIGTAGKRVRIAALLVDGSERIHLVQVESLKHAHCQCFCGCRHFDKVSQKRTSVPE